MPYTEDPRTASIARYVPKASEAQSLDGDSFRLGEDESLKGIWKVIRKRKLAIALGGLCGLVLAVLVCLVMENQYSGIATVEVGNTDASQTSLTHNTAPVPSSAEDLKTELATHMAMLQSDGVLLAAVKDLNLQNEKPFKFKPTIVGALTGSNAHIRAEAGLPLDQAPYTRDRILDIFSKKLKVDNVPDTRMITVEFLGPDPKRAADVANAIVREYVNYEAQAQSTSEAGHWLDGQLAQLKSNVESSQKNLADFEQKTGLNSLVLQNLGQSGGGSTTHVPVLDRLDTLNQDLTAAQTAVISKEAVYKLTQTQNPEVVAGLTSATDPGNPDTQVAINPTALATLQSLHQQQAALQLNYAQMATKYGPKNQNIIEIKSQLAAIDKQIADEMRKINDHARDEYLLAQRNLASIQTAVNRQQHEAGNLNASAVQLSQLSQEAASSRQLYDALYGKLKEVNIQAGLRATNIGLANPALPRSKPTRPNPPIYMLIGVVAGLFIGLSTAFVREHVDDTLTTTSQLHAGSRLPMLSYIPSSRRLLRLPADLNAGTEPLETSLLLVEPRSPAAESYRSLRTAINIASGGRIRSLLVTSPLLGEGKSTIAYNAAVAFALAGSRVLLLDADMRKPRMHELFNVLDKPGLSDLLTGTASLDEALRRHSTVQSLSLLSAGSETAMPAELLGSKQFDDLLKLLIQRYDMVVIDSPPILLVTDAKILSEKVDATIAVVRAGKTTHTILDGLSNMLESTHSRPVWLVLNAVDTKSIEYHEAYGHDGGDKYFNG